MFNPYKLTLFLHQYVVIQLKVYNLVKCTKYENCAILHSFHILYILRKCNNKTEGLHGFTCKKFDDLHARSLMIYM